MLIILLLLLISSAAGQTSGGASLSNITISHGAPLTVTTSTCPSAVQGMAYTCALVATGGTTPYTWSMVSRRVRFLPSGLMLQANGTISGSASAAGSSNFVAQVQDSSSPVQTASVTLSINVVAAGACGYPLYNCARSDWAAEIYDTMTTKPPDVGPNTCVAGMDNHLQSCGNLYGTNTIVTDPRFGVRVVRVTDYGDSTISPGGCQFPITMGPGGAAGYNVFSNDSQYFTINCGGGVARIKWFDPVAFQVNNCAHLGNTPGCNTQGFVQTSAGVTWSSASTPRFLYTHSGTIQYMSGTQVVWQQITNGTLSATVTPVTDWANAIPCWNNAVNDCPDWQANHTYPPGSNIYPSVNNATNRHYLQNINFANCTSGASSPDWATVIATPKTPPSGQLATYGLTWVITDGTCKWADLDIPPNNTGGRIYWTTGLAGNLTDTMTWEALGNGTLGYSGADGEGSCYIVSYDSTTTRYSQLNNCTGNVYNTVCSGGAGYNCSGGTFQRTYVGNIFRDTPTLSHGYRAMNLHSLWVNLSGVWTNFTFNNCSLRDFNTQTAIMCTETGSFNNNTYFWTIGTNQYIDAYDWLQTGTIGHDLTGMNLINISAGSARTLRDPGTYLGRRWGQIGYGNDQYWWVIDTTKPNTQTCTPDACWAAGVNPTQCGSAPCRVATWDQHSSWTHNDGSDTVPICTWTYSNDADAWPHRFPWLEELVCYSVTGTNHMSRELYPWNTQSNDAFSLAANIWSLSRDGRFAGMSSDWWCTLGKTDGTPANLCGVKFQARHTYAVGEYITPWLGPNKNFGTGRIYQVTTAGTTASAVGTNSAYWCATAGCTVTNGTVTFTYMGQGTQRSDVFLIEMK